MNCPNINHPDWKHLVSEVGENRAWQLYIENDGVIPQPQSRSEYMNKYTDPDGVMLKDDMEQILNKLSSLTGISWKWNDKLPTNVSGRWNAINGVDVNPNNMKPDTPWHEYLHPIVEVIYQTNKPLWNEMVRKLEETPAGKYVMASIEDQYDYPVGSELFYKEAITTFLGNIAANVASTRDPNSLWTKVMDFIKQLFNKVFGNTVDLSNIDENTPLRHFVRDVLVEGNKPIEMPYASSISGNIRMNLINSGAINSKNEIIDNARLQRNLPMIEVVYPGVISVDEAGQKVMFTEMYQQENAYNNGNFKKDMDKSDVYTNENGKEVTAVGKKLREMSASPEVREMSDQEYKDRMATVQADSVFKGFDKETHTTTVDGMELGYEQYIQYRKEENERMLNNGKARHKTIEILMLLAKGNTMQDKEVVKLQTEIYGLVGSRSFYKVYSSFIESYLDGDSVDYSAIAKDFGYNIMDNDEMFSERVISNEELGIAGTADIFVEHANGFATIKDVKTGDSIGSRNNSILFEGSEDVTMSPMEFAKLQVAFYAFLAKSNNKDLKFRNLHVIYNREDTVSNLNVDLTRYLPIIKHKLEKEGKTEWIKKNQDLFNAQNYYGVDYAAAEIEDLNGLSIEELQEAVMKKLKAYDGHGDLSSIKFSNLAPEQVAEIKKQLNNYLRVAAGNIYNLEDSKDMQMMYAKFGDLMNVSNERLQAFSKMFYKAYGKYWKEMQKKTSMHERLLADVLKENGQTIGDRAVGLLSKADPKKAVGFMWVQTGEKWRLINETDKEFNKQVNTPAKKAYHKFYTETMRETFDKATTRFQKSGLGRKYPSTLDPSQSITHYLSREAEERNSIEGIKRAFKNPNNKPIKERMARLLGYKEQSVSSNQQNGVAVTNLSYTQDHTFDTEYMFFKGIENLEWKAQMEDVYGIGKLMANIMADEKDLKGNVMQENNMKFLEDKLNSLILKEKKTMTTLSSMKIKDKDGNVKRIDLTLDTVLDGLRRWTTLAVMPLRPVLLVRNFLMEQHFNVINALKGSWAKRASMIDKKEFIEYTTTDFLKANKIMFQSLYDPKVKKKKNAIMQKYKFSVDFNYDYDTTNRLLSTSKLTEKTLYWTSKVGEDYNAEVVALSIMSHDGMWDKHDENGDYIGEKRGVYYQQDREIELQGYNEDETRRIREVIKRIHGSYSEDQKSNLEAMALGRMAMQFQKYKINYISRMGIARYNNDALGRFIKTGEFNKDGEPVFEWERQEDSGWLRLLGRMSVMFSPKGLNLLRNKQLMDELNLSDVERQNLMEMGVSFALFSITMVGLALFFDPDDDDRNKKNFLYKNLLRLKGDILSAYNPIALAQESKHPFIAMGLVSDVFGNLDQLITLEKYKRSSKRYGYEKGELKFMRTVKRRFMPMASTYREFQVLTGFFGGDVGYEFQFNDIVTDFGQLESKEFVEWWAK